MTILTATDTPVKLNLKDNELSLDYKTISDGAIFDICSIEGQILFTGKIIDNRAQVDLSDMNSGYYNLFIMDGGNVMKEQFMLAS